MLLWHHIGKVQIYLVNICHLWVFDSVIVGACEIEFNRSKAPYPSGLEWYLLSDVEILVPMLRFFIAFLCDSFLIPPPSVLGFHQFCWGLRSSVHLFMRFEYSCGPEPGVCSS